MKADDDLRSNLLARLFSYKPRPDGSARMEDYCTEALAWCLINSSLFSSRFLDFTKNVLQNRAGPNLRKYQDGLKVGTQIGYKEATTEATGEKSDPDAGRFDLVIESVTSFLFRVLPRLDVEMASMILGINDKPIHFRCKDFGA